MDGMVNMDGIMDGGDGRDGRDVNSPRVGMKLPGQLKTGEKKAQNQPFPPAWR